ncbi:carbamoyltransferase C-terminal domain-containing protein [Nostoc sp. LPT]|uniref:carbamoyltransferase family protein n=1 Tax=Nostoc sp. LPT TaxID=2815387 RepID=UPI001D7F3FD8|nr:carbamoyltransferase C-terminal domain-containing protein [Nostoc sp. LPT]MBN4004267.1 carbamoyltransferase [Nostoc sp. LPT]
MIVLGINSVYHESAASCIIDGRIVSAVEEERFNRKKHGKAARIDNPHILPIHSINFCLRDANLDIEDIDLIAFSFDPKLREKSFEIDPISLPGDWGSIEGEKTFLLGLEQVKLSLIQALGDQVAEKLIWVPHHLAHAASTFFPSGLQEAAILVIDGIGENASSIMAYGNGNRLGVLHEIQYPHSLGFLWEKLAQFLGFSEYDACKVMGLAAYGQSETMQEAFSQFARITDKDFTLEKEVLRFRVDEFKLLEAILGKSRKKNEPIEQHHKDIAASLQTFTDRAVLQLVEDLYRLCPSENLCYSGGVALNCVTNWLIKEKGPFKNIFVPTAPHDAGTAVGAALYAYHTRCNQPKVHTPQLTPYTGPEFTTEEILLAIEESGLTARRSIDSAMEAADMVADGKVVGWFQGRMEFGPRALGNRSLLADPRYATTRELLNQKVKHREDFRPFGPSVLAEKAEKWFEIGRQSESLKYMLFTCPVRPEKREKIPAVVHIDGTARVQLVERELNPSYHRLIERFEQLTGVPVILNTSFNDSEPIVCSPKDAISTFKRTAIDALIMQDFVIERKN